MLNVSSQRKGKALQNSQQTAAIILAAGTSSRMGGGKNKLLLPLHNHTVLAHVIEAAISSLARPIVLVLGHQAEEVRESIRPCLGESQLTIIENPNYRQGMSTSMQAGLRVLRSNDENGKINLTGTIFLLGDQPMVTPTLIDRLIALREHTGKRIALPLYRGQRGNPVVFSLDLADELMQVRGDEGGRSVLKSHPDEIAALEVGELAANFDVDTWEAYLKVRDL